MRHLTLFLLCCISLATFSVRPVRHILIKDETGKTIVLAYEKARQGTENIQTCFPSSRRSISTRAFNAIEENGLGQYGHSAAGVLPSIGAPKIPIIMVEFQDVAFQTTTTPELLSRYFNEKGFYIDKGWGGSVKDYFEDQSYGLFSPSFEVVGKVKLPKNREYYGENVGNSKHINVEEFYHSAVELMLQQENNFRAFEHRQKIPLVILFFAGASENSAKESGRENYLWSAFKESPFTVANKTFESYLVTGELINYYKSEAGKPLMDAQDNPIIDYSALEGPGVKCHEICHALGLPDAYDTQNLYWETPDYLDLMDYGQYAMDIGERPIGLSAYERNCLGWLNLLQLDDSTAVYSLSPLNALHQATATKTAAQAFLLRNHSSEKEYFVFENRQPSTWFPSEFGSGMLVYHIDYAEDNWRSNRVNVDGHQQRYEIIPADGIKATHDKFAIKDFQASFFPGSKRISLFSPRGIQKVLWNSGEESPAIYSISIKEGRNDVIFSLSEHIATGIQSHNNLFLPTLEGECFYDLQGKMLRHPQRGNIYLRQGQKVLYPHH